MSAANALNAPASPLRIGILSLAHVHAATYVEILSNLEDVELVCADPQASDDGSGQLRGQRLAESLGTTYVPSYEEVFASSPDGVIICSESARHLELTRLATKFATPILCEKPLATTLHDAAAMIKLCEDADVDLMTAYPVRFHPDFQTLVDTVRSGALGAVLSVSGTNNGQAPIAARPWFVDEQLAGGGAVMDHTVHLADLLDELLGSKAKQVYAQANDIVHRDKVEVETAGLIAITYEDDTFATIDCSWSAPASYPAWGGLTLTIECEQGRVHFDAFSNRFDHYGKRANKLRWVDYGVNLDELMLVAWLDSIRSGVGAQPDGPTGYRSLQIVDAAYRSINLNTVVAV